MTASIRELISGKDLSKLPDHVIDDILLLVQDEKYNKIKYLYPDTGPLRRELYQKHLEFFRAGGIYKERCLLAANRTGKTLGGCFEDTCHATGDYPEWWEGRRFNKPTRGWVAGTTNETMRDILQAELLGPPGHFGEGLIPKASIIGQPKSRTGVPDAVDSVRVLHKPTGGISTIQFKTYVQGRASFEGTARHWIHLDEECPMDIYGECLIRTMTTKGLVYVTFTPLAGLSEVVLSFLPHMRPETDDA